MTDTGLNERDLVKIQRVLGNGALAQVKENPYILSRLFKLTVVDSVAQKLGVPKIGNVHRGVALAEYELDKALLDGHCCVHTHTLLAAARNGCKLRDFEGDSLSLHGTIVVEGKFAMLRAIYDAEEFVGGQVRSLQKMAQTVADAQTREALDQINAAVAAAKHLELDADQLRAIWLLIYEPIAVITGAPGTGKTTCTRTALDLLDQQHKTYALCAPTGKAARRFSEVTGRPASTIHRLLRWTPKGFEPGESHFEYNENNPLPYDVVIVDESSMIEIRLAADLLAAIDPAQTRIIFIGDANQLPPVGPGAFFNDLIASQHVPTVWLSTLHRAAAGSWICRNAPKILEGKDVEFDTDVPDFTWYVLPSNAAGGIPEVAENVLRALLDAGESWDDFQLIVPMKIKDGGANILNEVLSKKLVPKTGLKATIGWYEDARDVYRNDRVIQTKNDYELDVFNGECGQVAIVEAPTRVRVRFGKEYRIYKGAALHNLAASYALTVHRVQGSEWPTVIVVCHSIHGRMLNRRLFYTAVTRARKRVIVIGDEKGVMQAIRSTQDMSRRTQLAARIKGDL